MAYVRIDDITGKETELQVNNLKEVYISENFGKYQDLETWKQYVREEIESEVESENSRSTVTWDVEDEVLCDYFDGRSLFMVYADRGYCVDDVVSLVKNILNETKGSSQELSTKLYELLSGNKE